MNWTGYGYMQVSDPRNFSPDVEECTEEEMKRHQEAVDAFSDADRSGAEVIQAPNGWWVGGLFYKGGFGIGLYKI